MKPEWGWWKTSESICKKIKGDLWRCVMALHSQDISRKDGGELLNQLEVLRREIIMSMPDREEE